MNERYIVTLQNQRVSLTKGSPTVRDVAVNHARTPMFGGHTNFVYYVGHHCIAAAAIADAWVGSPLVTLHTLLHEAEVATFGDVPGPVKCDAQRGVERENRFRFLESIGLLPPDQHTWQQVELFDKVEQAASASWLGLPESCHAAAWEAAPAALRLLAVRTTAVIYNTFPPASCVLSDCPMVDRFVLEVFTGLNAVAKGNNADNKKAEAAP